MKRTQNTIGLKFTYFGATNTKPSRYKVTQSNTGKSVNIDYPYHLTPMEFFEKTLNSIEEISSFSLMIDNTQNKYYLFCIDLKTNEIPNLLTYFKK
jgi:hypothetical protein